MKPTLSYKTIIGELIPDKDECIRINNDLIDIFTFFQNSKETELKSIMKFCEEMPILYKKFISIKGK